MNRDVLLIDDDPLYRMSVVGMLADAGYRVFEADSPEDGISVLDTNPQIRVVLLDLSFVGSPGTVVLDHIRRRAGDYRAIVLTAHDELLHAEKASEYAVFNYLPKAQQSSHQAIRFSVEQAFKDLERELLHQRIRLLLEVQESILKGRTTSETLDLICQAILTTVGAYTCHIRVYDLSRGDYHLAGFAGAEEMLRLLFRQPKAKGDLFSGRVAETGKPCHFDDLQGMEEFSLLRASRVRAHATVVHQEEDYFRTVQSAYIVPVSTGLFETAVDAVLSVSSESKAFFSEEKRSLVDEFVSHAAIAITKDWLQRKRDEIHKDYSQISGMLSSISDKLRGSDVLNDIYEVVTQSISEIAQPEVVSIFLFDEATGRLENVAELRGNQRVDNPCEFYVPGQSLTGSVFTSDNTIQLPLPGDPDPVHPMDDNRYDQANREGYLSNIPSGHLKHYLGVPIRMAGKPRGVLRAMNHKSKYYKEGARHSRILLDRGFSADSRNVLEITASHLAIAISNADLIREKSWQVEQVRTLGEVGRLINSELEIREVLHLTIRAMAEVMQAEICLLFLRDGEDRIVLKQSFGIPEDLLPNASYKMGEGDTGRAAKTGQPRLIGTAEYNNGKYDAEIRHFLSKQHGRPREIESLMVVPIVAKGTSLGAMKVINKLGDRSQYQQSDLKLFRAFADYVGVAIENAKIYETTSNKLAIAERNSALSLLVSAVAHEINNTFGLIPANVAGIRAQLGESDEVLQRRLAIIERVASQATEFANALTGFSSARRGERQKLDLNEVVRSAIEDLQGLPKYRNSEKFRIETSLNGEPLWCELFENPFLQVIRNILINAYQALEGRPSGVVLVSTSRSADQMPAAALLEFRDNGPGIPFKYRSRIFEPDFTTKPNGNGIGLWLVRTQLEQIGGRIDVESEEGKGATFSLRIPLSHDKGNNTR